MMRDTPVQRSGFPVLGNRLVLGAAVGLAVAIAVLVVFWDRPINHDNAWFLIATRNWLGGAGLYTDLIEVNPPLAFYLTVPSLTLADLFGVSDTNGQYLAVALLCLVSFAWCGAILGSGFDLPPGSQALLLLGAGAAVVLASLNGVGQREQVLVLCFLPWALREASAEGGSTGQQIRAAGFAAVGMCLKPYFVVLPLAVTVLNVLQARSLRPVLSPANLVFLAVGLAYIAFVRILHPTYLYEIVRYGVEVYGAYGKPLAEVLSGIGTALGLMVLFTSVAVRSQAMTRSVTVFVALSLGGLASYFLQGTGFSYHKVPFVVFGMIACLLVLLQHGAPKAAVVAAGIAAVGLALGGAQQGFYRNAAIPEITGTVSNLGRIDGVMTLSSHVYTGPPVAIALDTNWVSRYPANWLVPGAVNRLDRLDCKAEAATCDRLRSIAARNRSDNIADIAKARPGLLIVDRSSGYFDRPRFDWLGFMAEDPDWARVFAKYRQVATSDRFLYFQRQP